MQERYGATGWSGRYVVRMIRHDLTKESYYSHVAGPGRRRPGTVGDPHYPAPWPGVMAAPAGHRPETYSGLRSLLYALQLYGGPRTSHVWRGARKHEVLVRPYDIAYKVQ